MPRPATRVAVLISGEGSNLQALIDAAQAGQLGARIVTVVSNRSAARGLERARAAPHRARGLHEDPRPQVRRALRGPDAESPPVAAAEVPRPRHAPARDRG